MNQSSLIKATPWDTVAFGIPTWELLEYSKFALEQSLHTKGHYTLKVDPLVDKRLLHEFGFYYCDTLIEPSCILSKLQSVEHKDATVSKKIDHEQALKICNGAFSHGRFHRDFNLPKNASDFRYDNWLGQLLKGDQVYGLYWQGDLAGFIGVNQNNLVLHAVSEKYRGKGLAKFWWSTLCKDLLENGNEKVKSSISATNLAVLKLYSSLGFSFGNAQDIYHRLT